MQTPLRGPDQATRIPALAFGAIAILLLLVIGGRSLTLPPTFDGAMNLQVAWNVAEGHGYVRSYGEQAPFPREVQTNGPYVLSAALVYRLFGMGIVQSQLVNLLFLVLLAGSALWLGRMVRGRAIDGFLAVVMILATPGLLKFGFRGYGEIPGLALAVAGIALYPWQARASRYRLVLAAMLLGAAVITKTVMLVCVAPIGLVMAIHAASQRGSIASRAIDLALLGAAFLAPLVAWEAYRYASLGGLSAYQAWWGDEYTSISREAGVQPASGPGDVQLLAKAAQHFGKLAGFLHLPGFLAAIWLLGPLALSACVPAAARPLRWILAALLAAAAAYFIWWLGLTPTEKAWHRRIFNGIILVNIAWGLVGVACMAHAGPARRRIGAVATVLACCFAATFLYQSRLHGALSPVDISPIERATVLLQELPPDARLYAAGWSSAPQLSLLARRPLLDINDIPFDRLAPGSPSYLLIDQEGGYSAASMRILDMYPTAQLIPENTLPQVYRFDPASMAAPPEAVDLTKPIAFNTLDESEIKGFHKAERHGRWASADGGISTVYSGENTVMIELYVLPPDRYAEGRTPKVTIVLDDCALPALHTRPGLQTLEFPIAACVPPPGETVTIRIQSDALVESPITVDDRPMAFVARSIQLTDQQP